MSIVLTEISAEYLLVLLPVLARAHTHGSIYRRNQRIVTETVNLGGGFEANLANWVEGSDHKIEAWVDTSTGGAPAAAGPGHGGDGAAGGGGTESRGAGEL